MIKKITSLAAVVVVSASIQAQAPTTSEVPKLVVGITIDQLRGDYLQLFQNTFTDKGFKRLLNGGLVYQNVAFDFPNVNDASSIATIYTGTNPIYHGIPAAKKYSTELQRDISTFSDDDFLGNYTQDKVSPKALKSSSITDELKVASKGRSSIFSFAPHLHQALITAGWSGDCAFWIDDYSGKWASSTYFRDFHWTVDQENRNQDSHAIRAWDKMWSPLFAKEAYASNPYSDNHSFGQKLGSDKNTYILYKQTPFMNESVTEMASTLIEKSELGSRRSPDFVSISLYAGRYQDTDDYSTEVQDIYARLDRSLAKLLDNIDKTVGLDKTLIFVTSTGYYSPHITQTDEKVKFSQGTFYPERCEALLNMYLMAIYGRNDKWVDKYYDGQIFLNRELIKNKEISLEEIQNKAALFITEFTGVQDAYTSLQINSGNWNPRIEQYRNGIYKPLAGDIFVELQPGVQIGTENNINYKKENQVHNLAVTCPVIFFGNGIKAQKVNRGIKATDIAPSLARILRIRPPNAAKANVLPELINQSIN